MRVIREVHAGERPLAATIEARLSERASGPTLSDREIQVVELLSQGMRNKELAASLGITERTAEVHVRNILTKLHVKDRTGRRQRRDSPRNHPSSVTNRRKTQARARLAT